jgi:peptidoglycan-associated lipoprotein
MKKLLLVVSMAALLGATLAGCGSSVKLDDVPVTDVTGKPVSPDDGKKTGAGAGTGVTESTVKPVAITKGGPDDGLTAAGPRVVYFDYDSYVVKPEFQPVVEAHARYLKADKNRKMAIEGHTDERGGREYNLALGQKRSEAVRRAIGLLGGNDAQIEAVSFGKEKPAANGSDEAALAKNRRAEINYR